ncbi:type II toxin-antitoxin system RelE/ParE family toxin [Pseudomonas aeruginosa]|nr:hypothetical protein AN464_27660 [Pseudomonas aeruginosa]POP57134.1 type II toxin-antitoxin system RelE/ParE family toxin [Pseudomonas aeruginosa]
MLPIKWGREALNDLVEIVSYIEQYNATAAASLHSNIVSAAEGLSGFPYGFRPGRVAGTREIVVHPNYLVVYRVGDTAIDVLRVLHARQEYP